ncbi:uncharacterized protein BXZ73DRAFT_105282 [Epithele typhae]|uniref:uncharacterized protein n=1 Tax=Epithele typhae TaxID=378194 RepID=UPI002008B2D9|nr:uncharacterized protein BXZ73DRAFT_105282 [Epithele typhae]KAH9918405.1 hypothetical protein BXZ73DRAFT_105282 [Epithele typhae]
MSLHLRDFVAAHAFNFRDIIGAPSRLPASWSLASRTSSSSSSRTSTPLPSRAAPNPARTYLFRTAYPVHISSPVVATNKKLLRRCQSTYDGMNAARERDADLVGLVPVVYRAAPVGSVECPIALDACPLFRTTYMRSLGEIRVALERAVRYVRSASSRARRRGPSRRRCPAMPELALGHMVRAPTVLEGAPLAAPHPGGVERQWVWRSFWRDGCETDREWMFASGTQRLALLARRKDTIWREGGGSEADGAWV